MRTTLAATALLALGALAGCGGDESTAGDNDTQEPTRTPYSSAPPASVDVNVALHDEGKLDALFNGRDGECTSLSVAEAFEVSMDNPNLKPDALRELLPKTILTLRDADGSTIGLEELPQYGGSFAKGTGCDWTVTFKGVEPSDFYEVTVEHGDFSEVIQEQGSTTNDTFIDFTF